MSQTRRSLQDLAGGLFGLVISLRARGGGYGDGDSLRQNILGQLAGLERRRPHAARQDAVEARW